MYEFNKELLNFLLNSIRNFPVNLQIFNYKLEHMYLAL